MDDNWKIIVKEHEHLLDKLFKDNNDTVYRFIGIVYCTDDYYYLMLSMTGEHRLYSCVGELNDYNLHLVIE